MEKVIVEEVKKRTDVYNVHSFSSIQCLFKGKDFIILGPA